MYWTASFCLNKYESILWLWVSRGVTFIPNCRYSVWMSLCMEVSSFTWVDLVEHIFSASAFPKKTSFTHCRIQHGGYPVFEHLCDESFGFCTHVIIDKLLNKWWNILIRDQLTRSTVWFYVFIFDSGNDIIICVRILLNWRSGINSSAASISIAFIWSSSNTKHCYGEKNWKQNVLLHVSSL